MITDYKADLHIHTCLSPCADNTMFPSLIASRANSRGVDILGISDHNSAENLNAFPVGDFRGTLIAGIEIMSAEEIHILALFESLDKAHRMQGTVYENLEGENREDVFGKQLVVNGRDEITGLNKRLLISAVDLTAGRIIEEIHELGGLAIASHIDKDRFNVISQLGFIPEGFEFDALEFSPAADYPVEDFEDCRNYPFVSFSDAHFPDDVGSRCTIFKIEEPSFSEIRCAFEDKNGRSVKGWN